MAASIAATAASIAATAATTQAQVSKSRARLEHLLDTSYARIEELRQLLITESNLQWKDCTKQIEPIMNRQRVLHENVIKRLNEAVGGEDTTNRLPGKYVGVGRGARNIRNQTVVTQMSKPSLPYSHSMPSIGHPTLYVKEMPVFDSINEMEREQSAQLLTQFSHHRIDDGLTHVKDDRHWYGSLDRNMVKKKKRGPVDKARRHTKIVGSMAALERTDELQPDEQYKIGLPNLTRLETVVVGPAVSKARLSPPTPPVHQMQASPSPPPPPPPKTSNLLARRLAGGKSVPNLLPETVPSILKKTGMTAPISGTSYSPAAPTASRTENNEPAPPIRGWLETNLDESTFVPLNVPEAMQVQVATLGINVGYLDTTDSISRPPMASPATDISEKSSKSSEGNDVRIFLNETIKPFEMADYYKYSTKYRQAQNTTQQDFGKSDLANGNVVLANSHEPENLNLRISPNANAPKLPPRDFPSNIRTHSQLGLSSFPGNPGDSQVVATNSVEDAEGADFGWVMDTPTLV